MSDLANGITITTQCYSCIAIERYCDEHADLQEANQVANAYELVDEGNLQFSRTWSWLKDQPSGHDWIAPMVRLQDGRIRQEFAEPITVITDRLFGEPEELRADESVCEVCHYVYFSAVPCPNCN